MIEIAIGAAVLGVLSGGLSIAALWRVLTVPKTPALQKQFGELVIHTETQAGRVSQMIRSFRELEEDVEHHLEQATLRLSRAKTREANDKRRGARNGQGGPVLPPSIEEQFAMAEAQLNG